MRSGEQGRGRGGRQRGKHSRKKESTGWRKEKKAGEGGEAPTKDDRNRGEQKNRRQRKSGRKGENGAVGKGGRKGRDDERKEPGGAEGGRRRSPEEKPQRIPLYENLKLRPRQMPAQADGHKPSQRASKRSANKTYCYIN